MNAAQNQNVSEVKEKLTTKQKVWKIIRIAIVTIFMAMLIAIFVMGFLKR